jgi:hypothetical protein
MGSSSYMESLHHQFGAETVTSSLPTYLIASCNGVQTGRTSQGQLTRDQEWDLSHKSLCPNGGASTSLETTRLGWFSLWAVCL